jgi:hypothetical protein
MKCNEQENIVVKDPKTIEERREVAKTCREKLELTMPTLVDGMDDAVRTAYNAWPDRLFIVGKDGKVSWRCEVGPKGFSPDGLLAELKRMFPDVKFEGKDEEEK